MGLPGSNRQAARRPQHRLARGHHRDRPARPFLGAGICYNQTGPQRRSSRRPRTSPPNESQIMPLSPVAATPDQRRQATRRLKKEVSVRPWRWRAVQECLLAGAEPDTVGRDGRPVLMDAALAGHVEIMRLLLDMGANVNGTSAAMVTALMEAAATGLTEGCQLLIARGAKADQVDRDGWTALMCAALNGHVDVLRVLLDHGAKVDPTDHRDRTALHHATHNNVETAYLLLAAGADVNHRALDGTTTLMTLTESPFDLDVALEVVPALIAAGADPLMATSEGQTILGGLDLQHPAGRQATETCPASRVRMASNESVLPLARSDRCGCCRAAWRSRRSAPGRVPGGV